MKMIQRLVLLLGTDGISCIIKQKKDPGIVDGDFFNAGVISDNWYEAQGGLIQLCVGF